MASSNRKMVESCGAGGTRGLSAWSGVRRLGRERAGLSLVVPSGVCVAWSPGLDCSTFSMPTHTHDFDNHSDGYGCSKTSLMRS
jgi:hypothetical protein